MSFKEGSRLKLWRSSSSASSVNAGGSASSPPAKSSFSSLFRTSSKASDVTEGTEPDDNEDDDTFTSTSTAAVDGSRPSLSASSGKLSLNLRTSAPNNVISPDSTLSGTLVVKDASLLSQKDAKSLTVSLAGKCGATIMGKMRWQAAMTVNTLGGSSTVPVTYRETHTFSRESRVLWSSEDGEETMANGGSEAERAKGRYSFEIQVPRIKMCTCPAQTYILPPSVNLRTAGASQIMDRSGIEVYYVCTATLERKGKLKRDIKLKIPLTMEDDAPPNYMTREEKTLAVRGPMKYATTEAASNVPKLECELAFTPPTEQGGDILYRVTYKIVTTPFEAQDPDAYDAPPPEESAEGSDLPPGYHPDGRRGSTDDAALHSGLFAQLKPKLEVTLLRKCHTRPIERVGDGEEWTFPSYTLVQGDNQPPALLRPGQGVITGKLKVPKTEVTMFTCGAEIMHGLGARIIDSQLLRPIYLRADVFLPSGGRM